MRKQANPRKRRTKRISSSTTATRHSSVPTGRAAYSETRRWLLERHGPICGYCGGKYAPISITLDHVTPRRGQTAYDRRDNLVLACKRCNAAKADKPFLTYLLGQRMRAVNLLRYGGHLSVGILDIVRPLAAEYAHLVPFEPRPARVKYGNDDDEESPYLDSPYRASA
jgi:5-methylcytosine-specific restriction endonuclease McrA